MKTATPVLVASLLLSSVAAPRPSAAASRITFGPRGGIVVFDSRYMKDRYDRTMQMVGGEIGVLVGDRARLGLLVLRGDTEKTVTSESLTTQRNTHERTVINFSTMIRFGDPESFPVMPFMTFGIGSCVTEDVLGPVFAADGTPLLQGWLEEHTRFAGQLGMGLDIKPVPQVSLILGATYMFVPIETTRPAIPYVQNSGETRKLENLAGTFVFVSLMANLP